MKKCITYVCQQKKGGRLPQWLSGKESACNAGDSGDVASIPELGRCPGRGNGNLLQYSCLGNPMDREAWRVIVHQVAQESDTTEHTCTSAKSTKKQYWGEKWVAEWYTWSIIIDLNICILRI